MKEQIIGYLRYVDKNKIHTEQRAKEFNNIQSSIILNNRKGNLLQNRLLRFDNTQNRQIIKFHKTVRYQLSNK